MKEVNCHFDVKPNRSALADEMSPARGGVGGGEPLKGMDYWCYVRCTPTIANTNVSFNLSYIRNEKFSPPHTPPRAGDIGFSRRGGKTKQNNVRKIIALFILFICLFTALNAQQVEDFSLMQENAFVLNPAYAGTEGFMHADLTFRKQFLQIQNSPYTALLSADGQIVAKNIGLGGYLLDDVTGPTSKMEANFAFAYNLPLTKKRSSHYTNGSADHILSIGLALSIVQYRLDGSQLTPLNPGDPQLFTANVTKIFPDASFGVLYKWADVLYAGISVPQLMGLDINYIGPDGTASIKTVPELDFMMGGKYYWDRDKFYIAPLAALRWENGGPPQADIGLRFNMFKAFWIGAYYQTINTAIFQAGFNVKDIFTLAYSYNANLAQYHTDIGATHEISLGFTIPKVSKIWRGVGPALRF